MTSTGEPGPTRVVFLDIDGVVLPMDYADKEHFPAELMGRLRELLARTGAAIVLSSSWRLCEENRRAVSAQLAAHGLPDYIGCTPSFPEEVRSYEILMWLRANARRLGVVNFVALDDYPLAAQAADRDFFARHAVRTRASAGLTDADVEAAAAMLLDPENDVRNFRNHSGKIGKGGECLGC